MKYVTSEALVETFLNLDLWTLVLTNPPYFTSCYQATENTQDELVL